MRASVYGGHDTEHCTEQITEYLDTGFVLCTTSGIAAPISQEHTLGRGPSISPHPLEQQRSRVLRSSGSVKEILADIGQWLGGG